MLQRARCLYRRIVRATAYTGDAWVGSSMLSMDSAASFLQRISSPYFSSPQATARWGSFGAHPSVNTASIMLKVRRDMLLYLRNRLRLFAGSFTTSCVYLTPMYAIVGGTGGRRRVRAFLLVFSGPISCASVCNTVQRLSEPPEV